MNVLTICIRLAVVIGVAIIPAVFGETPEEEEWYKKGYVTPDADEAISFHTKAILANPNFAFGYLGRGRAKIRKKDFDGAIGDFTRAIEIAPNFSEAYGWRGRIRRTGFATPSGTFALQAGVMKKRFGASRLQICSGGNSRL